MSRKKAPPVVNNIDEPPRKPWTVGFIVIAAGSFSTWYWYKPLPPEAGQAAYSNWDHSPLPDIWDDAELVKPSLQADLGLEGPGTAGGFGADSNGIAGSGQNGLLPVPSYKKNLGELVATEPIPPLPSIAPIGEELSRDLSRAPNPWVSSNSEPSRAGRLTSAPQPPGDLSQANSPVGSNEERGGSDWPDLTYSPPSNERVRRGSPPGIPSLLSSSIPTEPAAIRTKEDSDGGGHASVSSSIHNPTSMDLLREEANRKPQFIRQPKRSE
jgi:hypothetical protein